MHWPSEQSWVLFHEVGYAAVLKPHSLAPFDCLVMPSSLLNHQYVFKFQIDVLWKGSNFIVGCMITCNTTNLESKTLQLQINTIPHKIESNLFVLFGGNEPIRKHLSVFGGQLVQINNAS
jgi:hypothetical protein